MGHESKYGRLQCSFLVEWDTSKFGVSVRPCVHMLVTIVSRNV